MATDGISSLPVSQSVVGKLTRAAIFLVVTINEGADAERTVRGCARIFQALYEALDFGG